MDPKPYQPPIALDQLHEATIRSGAFVPNFAFLLLLVCGFFGAKQLLVIASYLSWLPIRGLLCTPGWREAVHAISPIACLYLVFLSVSILLACTSVPRAFLYRTVAFPLGFTAYLIWVTSVGAFPGVITSFSPPPGAKQYACAMVHGISHVFLIPIGIRIGEHLRQRSRPRFRSADYVVLTLLLVIWVFAIIETKITLQHQWIRWLSFATLLIFAVRSLQSRIEQKGPGDQPTSRAFI
ncbi:hypothetical protein K239x_24840 [Planctomycetes bacterium K23_9]|uniref:DUF998 domain-containing protein n=1 Tax=Stieleria marina TaxID=1930275 RepID=A0A517NTS4_9BACT|nr:hypothetical protein K239x_24840 [Planctomycetes bacterium K23_9]